VKMELALMELALRLALEWSAGGKVRAGVGAGAGMELKVALEWM
jgi:hypothetical protein